MALDRVSDGRVDGWMDGWMDDSELINPSIAPFRVPPLCPALPRPAVPCPSRRLLSAGPPAQL